jgi:hypothetical protein
MAEMQTIRRITVYADQALEKPLLSHFLSLGSKGYTLTEARGLGEHHTIEDPFSRSTHIRIELLVQVAVADKIMEYLSQPGFARQPVAACVEPVQVLNPEHF